MIEVETYNGEGQSDTGDTVCYGEELSALLPSVLDRALEESCKGEV